VLELLAAFRQLRERGVDAGLVIAGQPLTQELSRAIAAEVGRCQAIRYEPRFVPEDEVQVYLNACDVVVFPYRQVLSSGAVVLAMSFARACVAPRLGCIPDVLDDTGAFLYDSQDERGLLDALTAACLRQAELQRMGEYNQRKVEQWDWGQVASETRRVYLAARAGARAGVPRGGPHPDASQGCGPRGRDRALGKSA
jgi:beta-1,4-mannosyltransferase